MSNQDAQGKSNGQTSQQAGNPEGMPCKSRVNSRAPVLTSPSPRPRGSRGSGPVQCERECRHADVVPTCHICCAVRHVKKIKKKKKKMIARDKTKSSKREPAHVCSCCAIGGCATHFHAMGKHVLPRASVATGEFDVVQAARDEYRRTAFLRPASVIADNEERPRLDIAAVQRFTGLRRPASFAGSAVSSLSSGSARSRAFSVVSTVLSRRSSHIPAAFANALSEANETLMAEIAFVKEHAEAQARTIRELEDKLKEPTRCARELNAEEAAKDAVRLAAEERFAAATEESRLFASLCEEFGLNPSEVRGATLQQMSKEAVARLRKEAIAEQDAKYDARLEERRRHEEAQRIAQEERMDQKRLEQEERMRAWQLERDELRESKSLMLAQQQLVLAGVSTSCEKVVFVPGIEKLAPGTAITVSYSAEDIAATQRIAANGVTKSTGADNTNTLGFAGSKASVCGVRTGLVADVTVSNRNAVSTSTSTNTSRTDGWSGSSSTRVSLSGIVVNVPGIGNVFSTGQKSVHLSWNQAKSLVIAETGLFLLADGLYYASPSAVSTTASFCSRVDAGPVPIAYEFQEAMAPTVARIRTSADAFLSLATSDLQRRALEAAKASTDAKAVQEKMRSLEERLALSAKAAQDANDESHRAVVRWNAEKTKFEVEIRSKEDLCKEIRAERLKAEAALELAGKDKCALELEKKRLASLLVAIVDSVQEGKARSADPEKSEFFKVTLPSVLKADSWASLERSLPSRATLASKAASAKSIKEDLAETYRAAVIAKSKIPSLEHDCANTTERTMGPHGPRYQGRCEGFYGDHACPPCKQRGADRTSKAKAYNLAATRFWDMVGWKPTDRSNPLALVMV